jgi:uncharacterized Zn-finger protein
MAAIDVFHTELSCDCGTINQIDVSPDNIIVCPDCGRRYKLVAYVIQIDENDEYME